jgi:hypothetical protein
MVDVATIVLVIQGFHIPRLQVLKTTLFDATLGVCFLEAQEKFRLPPSPNTQVH